MEGPRNASYLGHVIQNELLEVMAGEVKKTIENELHEATYYTLIVDELKDISKKEQLAVILRYVYQGVIRERFIAYVHATQLDAASLTSYVLRVLSELQLSIEHCVSQCYDGASVMRGSSSGVSARIKELNGKAVYIHCCAHRLNLVLVESVKANPIVEDFFVLLQKLYVFMSAHELFLDQQQKPGMKQEIRLQKLCETSWACRHTSINAIALTIDAIFGTLKVIIKGSNRDKAYEASGLLHHIKCFEFILSLLTLQKLFSITAKLSDVLQAERLDFVGAVGFIEATVATLKGLRRMGQDLVKGSN